MGSGVFTLVWPTAKVIDFIVYLYPVFCLRAARRRSKGRTELNDLCDSHFLSIFKCKIIKIMPSKS